MLQRIFDITMVARHLEHKKRIAVCACVFVNSQKVSVSVSAVLTKSLNFSSLLYAAQRKKSMASNSICAKQHSKRIQKKSHITAGPLQEINGLSWGQYILLGVSGVRLLRRGVILSGPFLHSLKSHFSKDNYLKYPTNDPPAILKGPPRNVATTLIL